MTTYSVTLKLTEKEFLVFMRDLSEPLEMTVKTISEQAPEEPSAPVKQRRGPRHVEGQRRDRRGAQGWRAPARTTLKEALQKGRPVARFALRRSLAALQKSGQVNRDPNGGYVLKAA